MDRAIRARVARSEASFNLRMDRAEKREDAQWKRTQERWKRADNRGEAFDRRLAANCRQFTLLFGLAPDELVGPTAKVDALTRKLEKIARKLDEIAKTDKVILKLIQERYGRGSH
jgi:hypothetical protein